MKNSNKFKLKKRSIVDLKEVYKIHHKYLRPISEIKTEIEESDKKFKEFLKTLGPILHKRLLEKNKLTSSWLYDYYIDQILKNKSHNTNIFIQLDLGFVDQIDGAAKMIIYY